MRVPTVSLTVLPFLAKALTAAEWKASLKVAKGLDPKEYAIPDYPASIRELEAAAEHITETDSQHLTAKPTEHSN